MLKRDYNFGEHGDEIYRELLEAHQGLSSQESAALNARLILILMNHIGGDDILRQAIARAKLSNDFKQ